MSIATEINRISNAKIAITHAITEKGVDVPAGTKLDALAGYIMQIPTSSSPETFNASVSAFGSGGGTTGTIYIEYITVDNNGNIVHESGVDAIIGATVLANSFIIVHDTVGDVYPYGFDAMGATCILEDLYTVVFYVDGSSDFVDITPRTTYL